MIIFSRILTALSTGIEHCLTLQCIADLLVVFVPVFKIMQRSCHRVIWPLTAVFMLPICMLALSYVTV